MFHRAMVAPALALILLALAVAALTSATLAPRPWAVDVGAPGDAYSVVGAYPAERGDGGSLRWARDSVGLRLPGAYIGEASLLIRLYREPLPDRGDAPWPLALARPGAPSARFEAPPGWRIYRVLLPPGASAGPLTLSGPTFQPGRGDPRDLGVAIDSLAVRPLSGAGTPWPLALARATWLALAVALAACAAWLLDRWALGADRASGRPRRSLALLAGLGAALPAWAWLDPMSLAWMLPTNWPLLGLAALLIAGLGASTWLTCRATHAGRGMLRPYGYWLSAVVLLLAHPLALMPILPTGWRGAAAWAILGAPGAIAALVIFADERDPLERLLLAAAGALGVAAPLVMALHALPGPLEAWQLLLAADLLGAGAWGFGMRANSQLPTPNSQLPTPNSHRLLIPILLIAAALRLALLGAAEFQGDEAYVMMLARGIRYGQPDILFVHMKGPVEALIPAGPLAITGVVTEWIARLPFALAGLAVLLGVWLLARRLLGADEGSQAGLVAISALAIDGFLIAFSRIVQYQSVIMLLSLTAIWLCWRFYEGAARPRRYLLAAAFCMGVALLAHYDGVMAAPALAWLVLVGGRRRGWSPRQWLVELAGPVALGLTLTLSFYLPFVLHEHFARTVAHLETRSGQGVVGPTLYNSLIGYAELAGFYSLPAAYVTAGLALLGGLVSWLIMYLRPRTLGLGMAALLGAGGLVAAIAPQAFSIGDDRSLAVLAIAPPLIALALAPRLPAGMRALMIWFGVPFVIMAFFFADPRTHFYTMHLPAALLAGLAVARLDAAMRRAPGLRAGLAAAGVALLITALPYAHLLFLRQRPEYQRRYPDTRAAIYRPLSGDTLADDGYFGFAQQDGWKAVAALFQSGALRGTVDSNQELFTSGWYLRGQFMCEANPDYYVVSENTRPYYIPPGYQEYGAVTVAGERTLTIFSRAPVEGPAQTFASEDYNTAYDRTPVPDFPLRRLLSGVVPQRASDAVWRAGFGLRGYDLDRGQLGPGDLAFVTFYWRAARPQPAGYQPVLQIRDAAGAVVAQAASTCTGMPSEAWRTNYVNETPFVIRADDLAPGAYRLVVAVRGAAGALLPLEDGALSHDLAEITVVP